MAFNPTAATPGQLPWRGLHHVALATRDLDATARFYGAVLGMVVSDIFPSREGRGRHCLVFVKPGDSDTWGLHFFERADAAPPPTPGASPDWTSGGGPLLHIAFRLPDAAAARALRERLGDAGAPITEIEELGSFVLWDNNGIMLEATWPEG